MLLQVPFESFVNSERCKTDNYLTETVERLRALLIQKDVKPFKLLIVIVTSLRALLIQKDVKQDGNVI